MFCLTGDGELQQGIVWEAIMHAPRKHLDNLCLLVDKNEGQLDDSRKLLFSMADLPRQIESFGWRVVIADGTSYDSVMDALDGYMRAPRDGRPTAIICNSTKGYGVFSVNLSRHKVTVTDELFQQELALQTERRAARMNLKVDAENETVCEVPPAVRSGRVPARDKRIAYDAAALPRYGAGEQVAAEQVFARDPRVVSQEREESMSSPAGWLSEGHGLDLTFLATAPNLDTGVNGATHMGNDDLTVFGGIAGLKIIDVSCPNQLVSVMRWIMDGNRGLVYLRIMRAPSGVLHGPGVHFEFGRAVRLHGESGSVVNLVSSGRGVHEIAEQSNGLLWNELGRMLLRERRGTGRGRVVAINTARDDGAYQFIHSATYTELISRYGLTPGQIAARARDCLDGMEQEPWKN